MNPRPKGRLVHEAELTADDDQPETVARSIGSSTSAETAGVATWLGVTAGGDRPVVDALEMGLSRALLADHCCRWQASASPRPGSGG